jgi:hypothetical protein
MDVAERSAPRAVTVSPAKSPAPPQDTVRVKDLIWKQNPYPFWESNPGSMLVHSVVSPYINWAIPAP